MAHLHPGLRLELDRAGVGGAHEAGHDRETASTEQGGSKPTWITDFFAQLALRPQIQGFVWFNHYKETDWRIESSATSTEAFATGVADSRYR